MISQGDNPDFRRYASSVAWHGYVGEPSVMSKVQSAHPEVEMYFTEGSTDYNDPRCQDDWAKWGELHAAVLQTWCRCAIAWNIATDDHGKPNIGPYPTGGILRINPRAQEIIRSGQDWARADFSRAIVRGARRLESQSAATSLSQVGVENPAGRKVLMLTIRGPARALQVNHGLKSATVSWEEDSMATLVWDCRVAANLNGPIVRGVKNATA